MGQVSGLLGPTISPLPNNRIAGIYATKSEEVSPAHQNTISESHIYSSLWNTYVVVRASHFNVRH